MVETNERGKVGRDKQKVGCSIGRGSGFTIVEKAKLCCPAQLLRRSRQRRSSRSAGEQCYQMRTFKVVPESQIKNLWRVGEWPAGSKLRHFLRVKRQRLLRCACSKSVWSAYVTGNQIVIGRPTWFKLLKWLNTHLQKSAISVKLRFYWNAWLYATSALLLSFLR